MSDKKQKDKDLKEKGSKDLREKEAKEEAKEEAKDAVDAKEKETKDVTKPNFSADEFSSSESPEEQLAALLQKYDYTISAAESCTGGLVCARLVNIAGISEYFKEGFVTYSNKAKRRTLGVSKATIRSDGAVSAQTAKEMAAGAAMAADTDLAVSVTGNAGPAAEEGKPVGLVYIGIYFKGKVKAYSFELSGSRNEIRDKASTRALLLCAKTIERAEEKKTK